MDRQRILRVIWGCIIICVVCIFLMSCASVIPRVDKTLDKAFVIKNLTVRIVGDKALFTNQSNPMATGWAYKSKKKIEILGYYLDDKLIPDSQCTLGHELHHVLNYEYPDLILHPHEINQ